MPWRGGTSVAEEQDQVSALFFRARDKLCALPIEHMVETLRPASLKPLADAPGFVLGISLIRGAIVPVVDAGAMLGADQAPAPTRLIVLRLGGRAVALAAEAVLGVRDIPRASLQALPPLLRSSQDAMLSAIGRLDRELLFVLGLGRIFDQSLSAVPDA